MKPQWSTALGQPVIIPGEFEPLYRWFVGTAFFNEQRLQNTRQQTTLLLMIIVFPNDREKTGECIC